MQVWGWNSQRIPRPTLRDMFLTVGFLGKLADFSAQYLFSKVLYNFVNLTCKIVVLYMPGNLDVMIKVISKHCCFLLDLTIT